MTPEIFWRTPLRPIVTAARSRMTRFVVLGKEPVFLRKNVSKRTPNRKQRSQLARITVAREEDLGANDSQFEEQSHVGYLMKSGDVCVGYDLKDINLSDEDAEAIRMQGGFPDVVIIRKLYGHAASLDHETDTSAIAVAASNHSKNRIWRLKRLDVNSGAEATTKTRNNKKEVVMSDQDDLDEEDFYREVEADREMRMNINLFRAGEADDQKSAEDKIQPMYDDENDEDDQQIKLDELLDNLALNDCSDEAEDNVAARNVDDLLMMSTTYEEGERAAKDGITYISRDNVSNVCDKDVPVVVSPKQALAGSKSILEPAD